MTGANERCPQCETVSWTDYGCAQCGLEFWPPSHAYQDASGLTLTQRVAELRAEWAPEPALSPIERKFRDAACTRGLFDGDCLPLLIPQYPVGRYRLDFALPGRKIGIELDGFASHSSTRDIENDRRRQRELEALGWRVIRFGGREVHNDAAACAREAARLIFARS